MKAQRWWCFTRGRAKYLSTWNRNGTELENEMHSCKWKYFYWAFRTDGIQCLADRWWHAPQMKFKIRHDSINREWEVRWFKRFRFCELLFFSFCKVQNRFFSITLHSTCMRLLTYCSSSHTNTRTKYINKNENRQRTHCSPITDILQPHSLMQLWLSKALSMFFLIEKCNNCASDVLLVRCFMCLSIPHKDQWTFDSIEYDAISFIYHCHIHQHTYAITIQVEQNEF